MKWGLRINVHVGPEESLMIEQRELEHCAASGHWSLGVIEKDYVLGWLLAGNCTT